MNDLKKYERVNACESLTELADVIRSFADVTGSIQGRTRSFSAEKMATNCEHYNALDFNMLTREFGIRQHALYILFFTQKRNEWQ